MTPIHFLILMPWLHFSLSNKTPRNRASVFRSVLILPLFMTTIMALLRLKIVYLVGFKLIVTVNPIYKVSGHYLIVISSAISIQYEFGGCVYIREIIDLNDRVVVQEGHLKNAIFHVSLRGCFPFMLTNCSFLIEI